MIGDMIPCVHVLPQSVYESAFLQATSTAQSCHWLQENEMLSQFYCLHLSSCNPFRSPSGDMGDSLSLQT